MLNISNNHVKLKFNSFRSSAKVLSFPRKNLITKVILLLVFIVSCIMFLPWTQNIQAKGALTTLSPDQRPQTVPSPIAGRIEKWYVNEGDFVKKGDTIAFLSEIKAEYLDPKLLERQTVQVRSKDAAVKSYESKAKALESQIGNLSENLKLKMAQAENKIKQARLKMQSDSINLQAAKADFNIASEQIGRADKMFADGVISKVDYERRQMKLQETKAKVVDWENKMLVAKNEILNVKIELNNLKNEYGEKISKAESDRFSAVSAILDAQGGVAKLESQLSSYELRAGFYYILAPQDCYIVKAVSAGIGETVKEGDDIVTIMPAMADLAVELKIMPMDVPLVRKGDEVRIVFDGWPAFAFSGWPGINFGTFKGKVFAVDRVSGKDNKFRILVEPDREAAPWPELLRVGAGAQGIVLLKNVPVWYEIWRKMNGFPPEFYNIEEEEKVKLKAPARNVK